jgi:hypothetical protein
VPAVDRALQLITQTTTKEFTSVDMKQRPGIFHKAKYGENKWNEMHESPTEQEKAA